jgi:hypothetical protein
VKLHGSTLREPSLEVCFERALAAMDVPEDALRLRGAKPVSGGESTYSSRANFGIVQAAAAPIALLPMVIVASGVTILVGVTIYVAAQTIDAVSEAQRCYEVKEKCIIYCSGSAGLPAPGGGRFRGCMRECMESHGCSF